MTGGRQLRTLVIPTLGMLVVSGCTWGVGSGTGDMPAMHRNLSKTVDIQTGVVQGDLEKARKAAAWILEQEEQAVFPAGGAIHREAVLSSAGRIAGATSLEAVAQQTGQLAGACGQCHQAMDAGPRFVVGSESPGGGSQEAIMVRHLWAADRMWEGLVGPSDDAWTAGAEAMAETQPSLAEALRASVSGQGAGVFLEELGLLAREAKDAKGIDARADVYGRLLATCDRCHSRVGLTVGD